MMDAVSTKRVRVFEADCTSRKTANAAGAFRVPFGMVAFVIPGPAMGKQRPRVAMIGGHARAYTPKETRTREGIVASLAMDAMQGKAATTEPVEVLVAIEAPIPASWSKRKKAEAVGKPCMAKPDLDNSLKLILDAINGIVFADDRQVVSIAASKIYGPEPRATVQITEIAQ